MTATRAGDNRVADLLRLATLVLAGAASLLTVAFVLVASDVSVATAMFLLVALGWCVSPYAFVALVTWNPWRSTRAALVAFATSVGITGLAAYIYAMAFFIRPDAQSGLVFLFIPLWQWVGLTAGLLTAWLLERLAHRRDD